MKFTTSLLMLFFSHTLCFAQVQTGQASPFGPRPLPTTPTKYVLDMPGIEEPYDATFQFNGFLNDRNGLVFSSVGSTEIGRTSFLSEPHFINLQSSANKYYISASSFMMLPQIGRDLFCQSIGHGNRYVSAHYEFWGGNDSSKYGLNSDGREILQWTHHDAKNRGLNFIIDLSLTDDGNLVMSINHVPNGQNRTLKVGDRTYSSLFDDHLLDLNCTKL